MKKVLCIIVVIGCLLVGPQPVVAETYTVGLVTNVVAFVQYKVAEVKGFWEKQGITVNVIDYDLPSEFVRSAMHRRFDLVSMPMPAITLFRDAATSDAVYLGTFSFPASGKLIILKKKLVKKSLKDHTIGIFVNDVANRFFLSHYLNMVNTDIADVRLVQMNPDDLEANFLHNRLQVVLTLDRGNRFHEQADGLIAVSSRDIYQPDGLILFKEGGIAAIPPEDIKKILRGCIDAIQWMRDPANLDEYAAILKEYIFANMPDLSDDRLRALAAHEKFVDPSTLLDHNQHLLRDYFARYRNFLIAEGSLKADVLNAFTYDNVIKNQALIEVLQEYVQ